MHAIAVSQPPPSAKPLMAAITGLPRFSMRSSTSCPNRLDCSASNAGGLCELADVGAGDEGLVARSCQDDTAHVGVVPRILKGGSQVFPRRRIQCIEHLGPIDASHKRRRPFSRTGHLPDERQLCRLSRQRDCWRAMTTCPVCSQCWYTPSEEAEETKTACSRWFALDKGAHAGDGLADDQILHLIRAFVGVERLGIGEETRNVVVGDDAIAAQQLAAPRNSLT